MVKKQKDTEINIKDIFSIIFSNKLKISLVVFFTIIITYFLQYNNPSTPEFLAVTKIKPISQFEESKYKSYNNYLKSMAERNNILKTSSLPSLKENYSETFKINNVFNLVDDSFFDKIDKKILYNLFLTKLIDTKIIDNAIKKFNFLNKEKYKNNNEYASAISIMKSSIKLLPWQSKVKYQDEELINYFTIEMRIDNKDEWKKFLLYINEILNLEVKDYLNESFYKSIEDQEDIEKYIIEDINELIKTEKNISSKESLLRNKLLIERNQELDRLKKVFQKTPIISDNFSSAAILTESTEYKALNLENKKYKRLFVNGFTSLIISIILLVFVELHRKYKSYIPKKY